MNFWLLKPIFANTYLDSSEIEFVRNRRKKMCVSISSYKANILPCAFNWMWFEKNESWIKIRANDDEMVISFIRYVSNFINKI